MLDFTLKQVKKERHESPARTSLRELPFSTRASLPDRNKYVPTFRDKTNYVIQLNNPK